MVQDLATHWIQSYPCKTKTSQETEQSLQKFVKPTWKTKVIYTDNSLAFGKACVGDHFPSTPHRSVTHGIAERAVRRIKEGTSSVLLQSGLRKKWWADSMECFCHLRNIQDLLSNGENTIRKAIRRTNQRTNNSIWFGGRISPFFCQRPVATASVRKERLTRNMFLGYSFHYTRRGNLERRQCGRRR